MPLNFTFFSPSLNSDLYIVKFFNQMRQALSKLFSTYEKILAQHPLKVQSLQTAILLGAGDVIAQAFVERDQKGYDIYRTLRYTAV